MALVLDILSALPIYASPDLPAMGDVNAPALKHVSPRHIETSPTVVGVATITLAIAVRIHSEYDILEEDTIAECEREMKR